MLIPGLVSISFRNLKPSEIIELCVRNKLQAIEWGGDVHCPHGEVSTAIRVGEETRANGLHVSAYGSYYRFEEIAERIQPNNDKPDSSSDSSRTEIRRSSKNLSFDEVLSSAAALKAPRIRVWAGWKPSAEFSSRERNTLIKKTREIADRAFAYGIEICFEYHAGTLTDTRESALKLIRDIDHPHVSLYWQPRNYGTNYGVFEENRKELKAVLPWLSNVHCFNWGPGGIKERLPLAEGKTVWQEYLSIVGNSGRDHYVLLEFIKDDDPDQLAEDSDVLRKLCMEWGNYKNHNSIE